ncbi:MAG: phage GP46 family protein [Gallionella sp.]|nr:phage GP46 family protein [Gallionella sp.]
MSDILTSWDVANLRGDWVQQSVPGADLESDSGLQTAVLISIFTDRAALPDDVIPDGSGDPRGWWGDDPEHPIGSRLWLLHRAKQTNETLLRAKDYLIEAVQWLIDDGAVAKFDIVVQWAAPSLLGATVTAYRQDGQTVAIKFNYDWVK